MKKLLFVAVSLFLCGSRAGAYTTVTTPNAYMVENTTGTDPSGNLCYDFQTKPSCLATINNLVTTISTSAIPGGSTSYIQNSAAPTTTTQVFSVSSGTVLILNTSTATILNGTTSTQTWNTGVGLLTAERCGKETMFTVTAASSTALSSPFVQTNLSGTITPHSTSSYVKVRITGFAMTDGGNHGAIFTLFRTPNGGSPNILSSSGSSEIYSLVADLMGSVALNYVDTPASVATQTYSLAMKTSGAGTITFCQANFTCTMTLQECF